MDGAISTKNTSDNNVVRSGVDFFEAMGHAAVVAPIEGVTQLAGQMMGKHVEVQAPVADDAGGLDGFARKAGAAIGSAIPFVAAALLTRRFVPLAAESKLVSFGAGAGLGFGYDTLFHPVYGHNDNFWTAKLQNATVSALTIGTMSVMAPAAYGGATRWSSIGNGALGGLKAGAAGGFVNAEADSLIKNHSFASADKLVASTLTFGLTGAALGGIGGALSKSDLPNEQNNKPVIAESKDLVGDRNAETVEQQPQQQQAKAEVPWFRRTKPNGDPEPSVMKGDDGSMLILDGQKAYSFTGGKWVDGISFSHDQIAEFSPVRAEQQVYFFVDQAENALLQAVEKPKE